MLLGGWACGTAPVEPPRAAPLLRPTGLAPRSVASTAPPAPAAPIVGAPIDTVSWSPAGYFIATTCALCPAERDSRAVMVWDLMRGHLRRVVLAEDFHSLFGALRFSPNERYLGVGTHDTVTVWRIDDGERLFEGRAVATYGAFSFSPDSTRLVWGTVFGSVWLQDIEGRRLIREGHIHSGPQSLSVRFDWDAARGEVIIATGGLGSVRWNSTTGANVATTAAAAIEGFPFAIDNLVTAETPDRKVWVAAHANGLLAMQRQGAPRVILRRAARAPGVVEWQGLSLADNGLWAVLTSGDGLVEVWDLAREAGRTVFVGDPRESTRVSVQFSADLQFVAIQQGGRLLTCALGTAAPCVVFEDPLATTTTHYNVVGSMAGGWLVLRTPDGRLIAHNPITSERRERLIDATSTLSFSSDGRFMAIAAPNVTLVRASDGESLTLVARRDAHGALMGGPEPPIEEAAMAAFMRGAP